MSVNIIKNNIFSIIVQALAIEMPAKPEAPLSPPKGTKKLSVNTAVRRRDAGSRKTVPTFGGINKVIALYLTSARSTSASKQSPKTVPEVTQLNDKQTDAVETTVQKLLQEKDLDSALALASGASPAFSSQVQTEVLRIILTHVDCSLRLSEQRTLPTSDNLCDYIAENNDRGALALLKKGARLDYSTEKCRGVLSELFSSSVMPLTINYLIENELLPFDLDLRYFLRSVNSPNVRLTSFLASGRFPRIGEALLNERTTYAWEHFQMLFAYQTMRHLVQNMDDYDCIQQLATVINMNLLTSGEYVALVRSGRRFNCFADRHILDMRTSIKANLRPYAKHECLKELDRMFVGDALLHTDDLLRFHTLLRQRPEYNEIAPALTLSVVKHSPRSFLEQQTLNELAVTNRRMYFNNNNDDDDLMNEQ